MGVADGSVGGYHEHAPELRPMPDDRPLVDDDAPKPQTRDERVHGAASDDPRRKQLPASCDLRPREGVGAAVWIDEQRDLDPLLLAEVGRLGDRPVADRRKADSRLLEPTPGAMQLHRVLAAEHSPVVAEEDQRRRAVTPEVAEPDRSTRLVLEDHVGQLTRVGRWMSALANRDSVQHPPRVTPLVYWRYSSRRGASVAGAFGHDASRGMVGSGRESG
jgi:hypothetical protein